MFKMILKNLWARRRRNGWLLAELILVSVVTWIILDPVIVVTHDRRIPLGYDADRLCMVSLSALQPKAPGYDAAAQDSAVMMNAYLRFIHLVHDRPGVESATAVLGYSYPNSGGNSNFSMRAEGDSIDLQVMGIEFLPHTRFFETYGFRPVKGMTPEQLSDYDYTQNDVIFTENTFKHLFHSDYVRGKRCWYPDGRDTIYLPVIGAVGTMKYYSEWRPVPIMFRPILSVDTSLIPGDAKILIRLKEGVSMTHFLHDFRPYMVKELRAGNLYARDIESYEEIITDMEYAGSTTIYRRNLAMAAFFLINLCLGVIGTFWLQTRTRKEEVGVILSFGGTPRNILALLMGEGAVLTFIAVLAGCFLYLQYALKEGLDQGVAWVQGVDTYWVNDFTQHFLIVSFIILLIMLAVVLIGIYIPARKISRIPPTEALRDE